VAIEMNVARKTAKHIEDYALIGDCETAALVGQDGSIDWLCWPRFDSEACFAAMLGRAENGRWLLAPRHFVKVSRRYRGETLILETRFETEQGVAVVTDFMPPRGQVSDLMRIVNCERGTVIMDCELIVRFGYGQSIPWVTQVDGGTWRIVAGPDALVLRTDVPLRGENATTVGTFELAAGQRASFSLTYVPSHAPTPPAHSIDSSLQEAIAFWGDWVARACCPQRYRGSIVRSLITLRALIYRPTGGIVAAPTTSLPERIGGVRNWDYRFCWLRDATMTLLALMDGGYYDEAAAWRDWLLRAVAGSPEQLQIMYGVAGERRLDEWEVPWLEGFQGSAPVRVGNHAKHQMQLDVIGELTDALHQARLGGLDCSPDVWCLQRGLLDYLARIWQQPDYGIWEMRGSPRHFTHSKMMCWVAFDRGIKDAERFDLDAPLAEWRELRDSIHRQVCDRGFDPQLNSFVQSYGSKSLDASLLLMPQVGFLPPEDGRVLGTIAAIERLLIRNEMVYRYDTDETVDGLPSGEGAFLACSFWLVDAYLLCGRRADAEALFERLLALCNDVGLLAEQFDPTSGRMLGNFPQGFSHLALVNTAFNLTATDKPAQQRSEFHPHAER
jgi:GH15 family glucan-1,4-alpha-glucosidase